MLNQQQRDHIGRATKTMQIITGALAFGVVTFAFVAIFVQPEQPGPGVGEIQSILAAGATVLALIAASIVPKVLGANMRQATIQGKTLGQNIPAPIGTELGDVGSLIVVYQTTLIVGAAILEGAAFYNLIVFLLEHQMINLGCAAVLVVAILFKFPTRSGVESWVLDELRSIEALRTLEN